MLLLFHGHCPRKDHHGNWFTSFIACYGLIPSATCMVFKHNNGANIPKNEWVMGLLSKPGVREFESKNAHPVSDEKHSISFLLQGKS